MKVGWNSPKQVQVELDERVGQATNTEGGWSDLASLAKGGGCYCLERQSEGDGRPVLPSLSRRNCRNSVAPVLGLSLSHVSMVMGEKHAGKAHRSGYPFDTHTEEETRESRRNCDGETNET